MADINDSDTKVSRREVFGLGSADLAAAATLVVTGTKDAEAQNQRLASHNAPNETDPGPQNLPLAAENPDSEWSPSTDSGTVKPFKYSFSLSHKRIESGGWTRQVTARELPVSTTIGCGVDDPTKVSCRHAFYTIKGDQNGQRYRQLAPNRDPFQTPPLVCSRAAFLLCVAAHHGLSPPAAPGLGPATCPNDRCLVTY
jgi:hypothetical protein